MNFSPAAIFKKERSIKLSDYFELVNPNYKYLQIITHKSIGEFNSIPLAKAIAHTYRSLDKRIQRERKKIKFETSYKISFMMDIQNGNASFYFIVPERFEKQLEDKVKLIWPRATVKILDEKIKPFSNDIEVYQMAYKKEDALSLHTDQRTIEPLRSILSVIDIMKEDDRVAIVYNFIPRSQFGWQTTYNRTMRKIDDLKVVDKKQTSLEYIAKSTVLTSAKLFSDFLKVLDDFTGGSQEKAADSLWADINSLCEERKKLQKATTDKKDLDVINTQIAVISDSKDRDRRRDNAISACHGFGVMGQEANNELIYSRKKMKKLFVEDIWPNIQMNTMSINEAAEFLQIPGRSILSEYGKITAINNTETQVPDELKEGVMCIGTNVYHGFPTKAYLSTDFDYRNLTLCIIGPTRAGKTNLICHLVEDAVLANETVINFDFCGNCEVSDEISKHVPKNKVLSIDCSKYEQLQGLGYNEIKPKNDSMFEVYKCTKMKAQQLVTFIDSINADTKLEPQMKRYLKAASYVVFINNGPIKDVFGVLENHVKRHDYIEKVPQNQLENLEEYLGYLEELDKWSNGTKDNPPQIIGTQGTKIQGILNRIDAIKDNTYTELMLKKDCTNNIDLVIEMQKPQLICLRMPEEMFPTDPERDVYCTYWLTKILGALQIRHVNIPEHERTKVNIIFDELYQIPDCQSLLKKHINRIAKKTCKPIISCHSLEQIKYIRPELKNANTSYVMVSGCDKANYDELKEELAPFELEDLLTLPRYSSLNLIKCNDGFARFITKLPPKYLDTVERNKSKEAKALVIKNAKEVESNTK
jgi:hypothetical protein